MTSLHFNVGCTVIKQLLFLCEKTFRARKESLHHFTKKKKKIIYIIIIKPVPKCLLFLAKITYMCMYIDSVSPVQLTSSS